MGNDTKDKVDTSKYWLVVVTNSGVNVYSYGDIDVCTKFYAELQDDSSLIDVYMFWGKKLDVTLHKYSKVEIRDPDDDKFHEDREVEIID